jgi:hypothetical protein
MKSVASLAIAALLAVSIPFPAMAQDAESADPMLTANYDSLISSLQAEESADLSTFSSTSTVNCVMISTLMADATADAAALDTAIAESAAKVDSLKSTINGNADLKAKLEAATCPIDDVVAATFEADGHVTVYVDDRA